MTLGHVGREHLEGEGIPVAPEDRPRRVDRLAAGIAAAFNTPITGVLFVVEEVVAAWDAAVLGSIVLAAVSAVVTTRVFLGDSPLFTVTEFSAIADPREALMYGGLGMAAGLLAAVYVNGISIVRRRVGRESP